MTIWLPCSMFQYLVWQSAAMNGRDASCSICVACAQAHEAREAEDELAQRHAERAAAQQIADEAHRKHWCDAMLLLPLSGEPSYWLRAVNQGICHHACRDANSVHHHVMLCPMA